MPLRRDLWDVLGSSGMVLAAALVVVATLGVWPPFVAVESGSMSPNVEQGDLVVIVDEHRFADPAAVEGTGVVPAARAPDGAYTRFDRGGDVILFRPNGRHDVTPVIHRAMFYVEAGENWYAEADPRYVGDAENCAELAHCPAPNAGFITLGDANRRYDQATWKYAPVEPGWVAGRAAVRVPHLGWIRLGVDALT